MQHWILRRFSKPIAYALTIRVQHIHMPHFLIRPHRFTHSFTKIQRQFNSLMRLHWAAIYHYVQRENRFNH